MPNAFINLTYRQQVIRLRQLAQNAVRAYDLTDPSFTLITHWNNTTFDVRSNTKRYVLRISRPGFQSASDVQSELHWLSALSRNTQLCVPHPIATHSGAHHTIAETSGIPEPRTCVLFHRRPGRFYTNGLTPDCYRKAGAIMAHLHNHAETFVPPTHFTRKTWDADTALGNIPAIDQSAFRALISSEEACLYTTVRARYIETWHALGQTPDVYGLIHADLHPNNILYHKGQACPIDFDECGWGHYLHDIAIALMGVRHHRQYPKLKQAFFSGYRQHRDLPDLSKRHLNAFIAGRLLGLAVWIAGVTDHPRNRAIAPKFVFQTMRELQNHL